MLLASPSIFIPVKLGRAGVFKKSAAFVDTNADLSVIRVDELKRLGVNLNLVNKSDSTELFGLGVRRTLGTLALELCVDGHVYAVRLHVLAKEDIPVTFLLGRNILSKLGAVIDVETGILTFRHNSSLSTPASPGFANRGVSCPSSNPFRTNNWSQKRWHGWKSKWRERTDS